VVTWYCCLYAPRAGGAYDSHLQELGGALFQRKPIVALTVLGHAIHPYLDRIAENAHHARKAAQAIVRPSGSLAAVNSPTIR
jgi:DNA-binding transcriptional LysR family regulator